MTYEEFIDFVKSKCTYETIYEDGEGRLILVIDLLGAYGMVNKAKQEWAGLTADEKGYCAAPTYLETVARVEAKLKEKNT